MLETFEVTSHESQWCYVGGMVIKNMVLNIVHRKYEWKG